MTVADCLPVYLYDTKLKTFAVCHSGWKGTGIVCEALKLMAKNYGTNARDVAAVLGPCIQSCCYRVDEERALQFDREFGSLNGAYPTGKPVRIIKHGQDQTEFFLDMQAANVKLLHDYGVHNIECRHECSVCGGKFGSFRREGAQFTKMLALVFCPQQTV